MTRRILDAVDDDALPSVYAASRGARVAAIDRLENAERVVLRPIVAASEAALWAPVAPGFAVAASRGTAASLAEWPRRLVYRHPTKRARVSVTAPGRLVAFGGGDDVKEA